MEAVPRVRISKRVEYHVKLHRHAFWISRGTAINHFTAVASSYATLSDRKTK